MIGIDKVQADRSVPDPDLTGPRGRKRLALNLEHLRAAGLVKANHLLSHLRSLPFEN